MAGLEELEQALAEKESEDTYDETEEQQDMLDAISLLNKCMHLLDYMSDVDLCKSLTKRERESMARLSDQVGEWLDEVEPAYEE